MSADGFFSIASVHRADLEDYGFDVSGVTDAQMEKLAERLGEFFLEFGGFWDALKQIAGEMGIPKRSGFERDGYCSRCGHHITAHRDDGKGNFFCNPDVHLDENEKGK